MAKAKTKSVKETETKTTVVEPVVEEVVNIETVVEDTTNDVSETVIPETENVVDIEKEQEAGEKELLKMFNKKEFIFEEEDVYHGGTTKRYVAQKPSVNKENRTGTYFAQKPF